MQSRSKHIQKFSFFQPLFEGNFTITSEWVTRPKLPYWYDYSEEGGLLFFFLPFWCHVAVINLCLFIMVGLQCVIVAFPGHTHLLEMLEMFGLVEA